MTSSIERLFQITHVLILLRVYARVWEENFQLAFKVSIQMLPEVSNLLNVEPHLAIYTRKSATIRAARMKALLAFSR